jgi:hypothetical protein
MVVEHMTTVLIQDFNPLFLAYDYFDDNINIVITSNCFINQPMHERIRSVYKCIQEKSPNVLESYHVFVHSFTEDELTEVLEHNKEGTDE